MLTKPKKLIRSQLLSAAIIATSLVSLISTSHAQTLADSVKSAVDTHPSSAAACFNERALFQSMIGARGALLPQATFSGALGHEKKDNFQGINSSNIVITNLNYQTMTFTVSQLAFDGDATKNVYCAAQKRRNAAHFDNLSVREQLTLNTATAYLDIIQFRQIKKLSERNVGIHKEVMENAKRRYSGGAGQKADLELVQARLALAESRLESFQTQLENSIATYYELTHIVPQTLIIPTVPEHAIPGHLDEVGYCANPQIQSAVSNMQATKHDSFAASSQFLYPVVNGNLNFTRGLNIAGNVGYQNDLQAFVSATYNIYKGGSEYARVKETCARRFQAREQLISTQQFVEKNGTIAWNNIQSAITRIKELTDYVTNLSQVLTAYYKQYDLGQRSMLNLLDVENELFNAKVSLVTEEITKLTSAYQLISTTGKLEATILDQANAQEGIQIEFDDTPVRNASISPEPIAGIRAMSVSTSPTNNTPTSGNTPPSPQAPALKNTIPSAPTPTSPQTSTTSVQSTPNASVSVPASPSSKQNVTTTTQTPAAKKTQSAPISNNSTTTPQPTQTPNNVIPSKSPTANPTTPETTVAPTPTQTQPATTTSSSTKSIPASSKKTVAKQTKTNNTSTAVSSSKSNVAPATNSATEVACPFCNATLPQDSKPSDKGNANTPKDKKQTGSNGQLVACPFCNATLPQDSKPSNKDNANTPKDKKNLTQLAMDDEGEKNDEKNPTSNDLTKPGSEVIDDSSNQTIDRENQATLS